MESRQMLESFMSQYGWDYDVLEGDLLLTGFRGADSTFRVFIEPGEVWVIMAIVPYVARPVDECQARFWSFLMRLNYEMNLAKVSCDPEGDVVLSVELRATDLRFSDFREGLDILVYYADRFYIPLTRLAVDPDSTMPELSDLLPDFSQITVEDVA